MRRTSGQAVCLVDGALQLLESLVRTIGSMIKRKKGEGIVIYAQAIDFSPSNRRSRKARKTVDRQT